MKLEAAREFGKELGLKSDAEYVNNITLHTLSLFGYDDFDKELRELIEDAKKAGIKFHKCGMAMIDDKCYMCEKFTHLMG